MAVRRLNRPGDGTGFTQRPLAAPRSRLRQPRLHDVAASRLEGGRARGRVSPRLDSEVWVSVRVLERRGYVWVARPELRATGVVRADAVFRACSRLIGRVRSRPRPWPGGCRDVPPRIRRGILASDLLACGQERTGGARGTQHLRRRRYIPEPGVA